MSLHISGSERDFPKEKTLVITSMDANRDENRIELQSKKTGKYKHNLVRKKKIMDSAQYILQNFQLKGLHDSDEPFLARFLKNSNNRLEMIKAGRRLDNLISYDCPQYKKDQQNLFKITQKNKKIINLRNKTSKNSIISLEIKPSIQYKFENEKNITDQKNPDYSTNSSIKLASKTTTSGFQLRKLKSFVREAKELSPLLQTYLKAGGFTTELEQKKFEKLKDFFKEKYKMMSKYLSEDELNKFICKNNSNPLTKQTNINLPMADQTNDEENETLELIKFFQKEEEKSETTLKKIVKINNQISLQLMEEDHAKKMQQLQDLRVKQNRQLFKLIDELPNQIPDPKPFIFIHSRPKTTDDGFCKRVFLRAKTKPQNQDEKRPVSRAAYNPNIDPNNQAIAEIFMGFNKPNQRKIQNSFIGLEKTKNEWKKSQESFQRVSTCTNDQNYRYIQAEEFKKAFRENSNEKAYFISQNNSFRKNSLNNNSIIKIPKSSKPVKPTPKIKKGLNLADWKMLPESLRDMVLMANEENFDKNTKEERPKYLTKFNKTVYRLKTMSKKDIVNRQSIQKQNYKFESENEFKLSGKQIIHQKNKKNYQIYNDNNFDYNDERQMNFLNFVDSSEWKNAY